MLLIRGRLEMTGGALEKAGQLKFTGNRGYHAEGERPQSDDVVGVGRRHDV
jgi:hypothetical protein